jgi:hypothetical protein
MKRNKISAVLVGMITILVLGISPVMAAKPLDIIYRSNGFPSGKHFNLNLHGRDPANFTGDPTPGGKSVFIGLYGDSTVEYFSNKRNRSNTELTVLDPLAEPFDGDAAQVYLPYNIHDESDNTTKPADGYYVFGRILGKPNNGASGNESSILLYPNFVATAANATDNSTDGWPFGFDPDADLLGLGLVTTQGNLYKSTPEGFVRFDPPTDDPNEKGKGEKRGKSKAVDITSLFEWTGYVSDNLTLDSNANGYLDVGDVPADQDGDLDIDEDDLVLWLEYLVSIGEAVKYEEAWIFDIADMVISGQTVANDGTKLFQVRFYPVATTEFTK